MASTKNLEAAARIYCQREITDIVMDYRLVTAIAEAMDAKDAEIESARAARETVWIVTEGDGDDGNEWRIDGVYSTQEAADAAHANRPNMSVEVWPLES